MDCKTKYVVNSLSSKLPIVEIDEKRRENAAYEYLCHLEEARLWMEECIQENLPHSVEFETRLRNGVYLAKVANFIAPHIIPLKKIFDLNQEIYENSGLHYRHTDNINYWISAMKAIGLPPYFYPNSFDVYGKKNMPKAIYCLHALSLYLHRCGRGIKIIDLLGKLQFSSEEISFVCKEFKEFSIQLPAFSKIGGILFNEVSPNDTTLHAAIIAINIAICHQNDEYLLAALTNPNAGLQNVVKENAVAYQRILYGIKSKRKSELKERKLHQKIELCWEFLPQKVIQESIDSVNLKSVFNELKYAALSHNIKEFTCALQHPFLNVSNILEQNIHVYMSFFKQAINDSTKCFFNQIDIQNIVSSANYNEYNTYKTKLVLINLNNVLESDDYFESFNILKSFVVGIELHDFGKQFYHLQLKSIKKEKCGHLNFDDIQEYLPLLTTLLDVSMAVIQQNKEDTFKYLSNPMLKCLDLDENLKSQYFDALKMLQLEEDLNFLSIEQIKKCILATNETFKLQQNEINSSKNINFALSSNNVYLLMNSLTEDPSVLSIDSKNANLYFNLLTKQKMLKNNCDLSRHEIQNEINIANDLVLKAEYFCGCLANVNIAIDNKDANTLLDSLRLLAEESLCFCCKENFLNDLSTLKKKKFSEYSSESNICDSWVKWEIYPEITFFLNIKTLETAWNMHKNLYSILLDKKEIIEVITTIRNKCKCYEYKILNTFIVSLQSYIRGFLIRQSFSSQKLKLSRTYTTVHMKAVLKLQSFIRMSITRKKYLKQKAEKLRLHSAARIIQRQWKIFKVHKNLNILAYSPNPPLSLMQKIIYMLEISNDYYSEEFKLHNIKGKVVQTIRYNQSLLKEIDEMDIKIGLLIRNRIKLEDLLAQKKKSNVKTRKEIVIPDLKSRNLKLFSKKYNTIIEFYQHLLYLLQTKPEYLSNLMVSLPSNQTTSLIESIVFCLYNYGSTPREEYLLLKMFCFTLNEEIKRKGDDLGDIMKGENIIMKIIISFYRKSYWRDCLRKLLEPLVSEVLNDKCTLCSTDPIEIYKVWQNEIEMETGKKSEMPQNVTVDDVLFHPEVNYRFNQFLDNLLKYSLTFCEAIVDSQSLIPYGIMYICKFLKHSLQKKYPLSSTEELNKIIGNFLYYRYINPAIIAPDVFDIITIQHGNQIADYERLKLSAVAKFLHLSVSGKKYTEDLPHLMCLNPYLRDCYKKFMSFFDDICKVKELEEHFNIGIFSEAVMQISEVYMSFKELQSLHKLLIEKEYDLAPETNDILHEILDDFDPNSFDDLCYNSEEFLNTEICLSLKSKYELEVEDETKDEKIFIETKFMIITLLQIFANVNNMNELLFREPTLEEELMFQNICFMKQRGSDWKTLSALQSAVEYNLNLLELSGYVSSTDNYQDILNNIAKEIVNRWRYRISRKSEIANLIEIQKQLDLKTVFYLEKLDYYNKYIAICLENMKVKKRNSKIFHCKSTAIGELQNKRSVKCSGNKLHEKGILIEIKNLDICQFKNINFEISPTEDLGIFVIKAKFVDVPIEMVDIDIQELLCLQYQGISEMIMFECVKVNNNLLLHFLNSKFYGKNLL